MADMSTQEKEGPGQVPPGFLGQPEWLSGHFRRRVTGGIYSQQTLTRRGRSSRRA